MAKKETTASTDGKKAGVIAAAGAPEPGTFPIPTQSVIDGDSTANAEPAASSANGKAETHEEKVARELAGSLENNNGEESKLPDLTDDQLKEIFEKKGIKGFDGNFQTLKEKLEKADAPAASAPTDEEKKAADLAFEKRMLDFHIESGGTPESFVALRQIAAADLRELSIASIRKEMQENGFTQDEIEVVLKERYFQLNPEELTQGEEETDEDFAKRKELAKKKVSYGTKKLEGRAAYTQTSAKEALNDLREAIKAKDAVAATEAQISSKVDEISKTVARQITFELGEVNKTKLDPITYKVTDADIAEVANTLKDPVQRKQLLFNEDGTLNLSKVMDVMVRNKYLESAVKASFLEGGNRQVAAFKKVFPNSAHALGVGGESAQTNTKGRKGVLVSAGQPEVVNPQR